MKSSEKIKILDDIGARGNLAKIVDQKGDVYLCRPEFFAEDEEDPFAYCMEVVSDDPEHRHLARYVFEGKSIKSIKEIEE